MLTNPFPQQGFVATQLLEGQVATQPSPSSTSDYQILMMKYSQPITIDLNLQTQSRQYPSLLLRLSLSTLLQVL